jgi:hypothetical protein
LQQALGWGSAVEEDLMGRADVYSQAGAPDPVLPAPVVLELARAHLNVDLPAHSQVEVDESRLSRSS